LGDWHFRICRGAAELLAIAFLDLFIFEKAVQVGRMGRVDANFKSLQPITFEMTLEGKGIGFRGGKAVELRKGRRLSIAEEREQHAASFDYGKGTLANARA